MDSVQYTIQIVSALHHYLSAVSLGLPLGVGEGKQNAASKDRQGVGRLQWRGSNGTGQHGHVFSMTFPNTSISRIPALFQAGC